jgi:hypothetical protein
MANSLSKREILQQLNDGFGELKGTCRPNGVATQLDRWLLNGRYYLVTTANKIWETKSNVPPYTLSDRVEMMIEVK